MLTEVVECRVWRNPIVKKIQIQISLYKPLMSVNLSLPHNLRKHKENKDCLSHINTVQQSNSNTFWSERSACPALAAGINVVAIVLGIIFLLSSFSLRSLLFYQKGGRFGFSLLHGLLSNKNIRIPINNKKFGDPPTK